MKTHRRDGRILRLGFTIASGLLALLAAPAGPPALAQNDRSNPAVPSDNIEDHAALGRGDSPRAAEDLARDASEKPTEIAAFAGVIPKAVVADLRAGDGYLTEVLALGAYPYGKVFANNDPASVDPAEARLWDARLEKTVFADTARFDLPLDAPLPIYAVGLDVVVSAGAYGDAIRRGIDRKAMNAAAMKALMPGGFYVIADARAAKGTSPADAAALCRADETQVRAEVEAAGFRFVEASAALGAAADPHTRSACKHVGAAATDRFLLKFQKPPGEPPPLVPPLPKVPGLTPPPLTPPRLRPVQ